MIAFNKKYFIATIILFAIEIFIALYVHDKIIRPYIGDMLAIILIYTFIKSFLKTKSIYAGLSVLLFSYTIEILQFLNILDHLGLKNNVMAKIVLGGTFDWIDLINYTLAVIFILIFDRYLAA